MNDLVEFLLARIVDDEERTRLGAPFDDPDNHRGDYSRDWDAANTAGWHTALCGWRVGEGLDIECTCGVPARVLAECEAKRRIITEGRSQCGGYIDPNNPDDVAREQEFRDYVGEERYQEYAANGQRDHWPAAYCAYCDGCAAAQSADRDREWVIKALAAAYADHPDYRQEWRP